MESSSTLPRPRIARRTLDNLAWALLAVALGWLAQGLLTDGWLTEGLLLYAVAIPLFAVRLAGFPSFLKKAKEGGGADDARQASAGRATMRSVPLLPPLRIADGMRGWLGGGLLVGAAMVSLIDLRLFDIAGQDENALVLYLFSLLLFGVGAWLAEPPDEDREIADPKGLGKPLGSGPGLSDAPQPQDDSGTANPKGWEKP